MIKMVQKEEQSFQVEDDLMVGKVHYNREDGDGEDHRFCEELTSTSIVNEASSLESSMNSTDSSSTSSSDLMEDAASSTSSDSSSSSSNGPLYELSDLMAHLPIKRGLSKYYEGKSQSFTSLACVKSTEDLVKKAIGSSCKKRIKSCKSYRGNLGHGHRSCNPKAIIKKKASKATIFISSLSKRNSLSGTMTSIPVHRS